MVTRPLRYNVLKNSDVISRNGHATMLYPILIVSEYMYNGGDFEVTQEMKEVFDWDGCFVVRYAK